MTSSDCTQMPVQQATAGSSALLQVTVYPPARDGFGALKDEWNGLLRKSRFNSLFLTWEWQTTWWRNLGRGEAWILALRQPETNELVGIAALYLITLSEGEHAGKRQLNLVGCIDVSDYLDLIIATGHEQAVYQSLIEWLKSPEAPQWDIFDLCNLPEASLSWQLLPPMLQAQGWQVETFQEDTAPQFAVPFRYETYLQEQVEKKQRHEIRRKQRRAEREVKTEFYIVGPKHSLEVEIEDFVALQRASRADKSEFMTPEMHRFFLTAARNMQEAGWLRLMFLTLNGEKAATLYAFEYDKRFWLYNSGYDPDSHSHLSPGWVILSYAIQYAIETGCRVFDFMQGNEEYKYLFGAQDYKVMRVIVRK